MVIKKKIICLFVCVMIVSFLIWLVPDVIKYRKAVKASGGLPFQAGLTKSVLTKCIMDPNTGTCPNHDLCLAAPGKCSIYIAVDGTPAGGMGSQILLADVTVGKIGLTQGTSIIAGGKSPVFIDVSASIGGTAYGVGRRIDKTLDWFDYIIAGIMKN